MKVLFLDIDGVLNNDETTDKTPSGFTGVDMILVQRLQHLIEATSAKIVLSSTWKEEWNKDKHLCHPDGQYLSEKLKDCGLIIEDKISDGVLSHRGLQIKEYLDKHKHITSYAIVDDFNFDFADVSDLKRHFIQTNKSIGLTDEDVNCLISILGKN